VFKWKPDYVVKEEIAMKEINVNKKLKVIKLFLAGASYEEVTLQVGVSKGSAVNIIDGFRDSSITVPPSMTGYIDELRYAAVELKKHNTTVSQLKSYFKLHIKLQEMAVGSDKVEQWVDILQSVADNAVDNNHFVQAALELAEVTSGTGLSYKSVIQGCTQKSKQLTLLDS
jgi:chromosome segregation ATPase